MSALTANCPSCGAPVSFKSGSSIVVICNYCRSAVARTDRELRDIGRVAELIETGSPLQLGLHGAWQGVSFELTGRAQMGHESGGVWDEWYATFANGSTGWLAEAQGRFYLTFADKIDPGMIPPLDQLRLGLPVESIPAPTPPIVAEIGLARGLGAIGEIPYELTPGQTFYYADLSGSAKMFATIDFSDTPPTVYSGKVVTLAELGLADARAAEREAHMVTAVSLSCPNCGGSLALHAPDRTERVGCPNCNGLIDVNQGQLSFLKSLGAGKYKPDIQIGSFAEFSGANYMVLGFVVRSVEIGGLRYFWSEYLLYHPHTGFRWLVNSDKHWSFVQAVAPGDISDDGRIRFQGKSFRIFQDAPARVEYVMGEFYWKVEVGETVQATDYVKPPEMLSRELTVNRKQGSKLETGEVNWSLGTYVPRKEIEKKFNVQLQAPSNVAPNQPFLYKSIYPYCAVLAAILFITTLLTVITRGSNDVITKSFHFEPLQNAEATQVTFSDPFELVARRNIRVQATSGVDNSWIYVAGDFINDDTGLVQTFELPIEYYYGVEDGERWTEGSQSASTLLSALPAGKYTLRLEAQWGPQSTEPANITIKVDQGHTSVFNFLATLIAISIIPAGIALWQFKFERRRWSESMFTDSSSSSDDGE
ncbi:MAG: DUF4178 domain-containing protein [Pyrinomonadaceae bacterium]